MKIALLFTTYNKKGSNTLGHSRTEMYEDVLNWWIHNSKHNIFVTNSGNDKFSDFIESNTNTYHFSQDEYPMKHWDSKGYYESISVHKCFKHFEKKLMSYDMIFKISGKYKFYLDPILPNNPEQYDFIRLNNKVRNKLHNHPTDHYWVPTEIIGFKPHFLKQNFYNWPKWSIETGVYKFMYNSNNKYKIYTLPSVQNLALWKKNLKVGVLKELFTFNNVKNKSYKHLDSSYSYPKKFAF